MATVREKLTLLIDHLLLEQRRGLGCAQVAQAIQQARADVSGMPGERFFGVVEEACRREALLSLAKLLIAEGESISIDYLLNCALEIPSRVFHRATRDEILESVQENRQQIGELAPLVEELKAQRDRILAHLDRKHVNEPEVLDFELLDMGLVIGTFERLGKIVQSYQDYLGDEGLSSESESPELIAATRSVIDQLKRTG
jgi:hypothetical protein